MRKFILSFLALFTLFMFVGCVSDVTDIQSPTSTQNGSTQLEEGNKPSDTDKPNSTEKPSDSEKPSDNEKPDEKEITTMYIYINGNKLEVTLANNSSVDALVEILKKGDITYTADDYGDFEKVGNIGYTLPRNDTEIDTQAGDVILYQGNNICLYYGTNSWNFTRLGKINGYSTSELRNLLGAGNGSVQVKISLK